MAEQEEKQDCAGGKNLHIYPPWLWLLWTDKHQYWMIYMVFLTSYTLIATPFMA